MKSEDLKISEFAKLILEMLGTYSDMNSPQELPEFSDMIKSFESLKKQCDPENLKIDFVFSGEGTGEDRNYIKIGADFEKLSSEKLIQIYAGTPKNLLKFTLENITKDYDFNLAEATIYLVARAVIELVGHHPEPWDYLTKNRLFKWPIIDEDFGLTVLAYSLRKPNIFEEGGHSSTTTVH